MFTRISFCAASVAASYGVFQGGKELYGRKSTASQLGGQQLSCIFNNYIFRRERDEKVYNKPFKPRWKENGLEFIVMQMTPGEKELDLFNKIVGKVITPKQALKENPDYEDLIKLAAQRKNTPELLFKDAPSRTVVAKIKLYPKKSKNDRSLLTELVAHFLFPNERLEFKREIEIIGTMKDERKITSLNNELSRLADILEDDHRVREGYVRNLSLISRISGSFFDINLPVTCDLIYKNRILLEEYAYEQKSRKESAKIAQQLAAACKVYNLKNEIEDMIKERTSGIEDLGSLSEAKLDSVAKEIALSPEVANIIKSAKVTENDVKDVEDLNAKF